MRLERTPVFIFFLFFTTVALGQPGIDIPKKFFTLRNSRLNVGINISSSFVLRDDQNERFNVFNHAIKNLPDDYSTDFTGEDIPYILGGILFDLFSPNSSLGLSFGAEYTYFNYDFTFNDSPIANLTIQQVRFPAYLKLVTGGVHDKVSGVIMGGAYYTLPINYERIGPNDISNDINELSSDLIGASFILGIQTRFFNESDQLFDGVKGSRAWLYLRGDYSLFSVLGEETLLKIVQSSGGDVSFHPLSFSLGLGFFF
jgi:hypothetical protein